MITSTGWLGGLLFAGTLSMSFRSPRPVPPRNAAVASCVADSNYQRLAFWVGDWDVVDSTGAHYATQHVTAALDSCAIVAEWNGTHGDRGLNVSAYDAQAGEWRQVYASNQVPARSGVSLRRSDPSYSGPGIRFIPLVESSGAARSRVTILPLQNDRAMQLFEDSRDGGSTWQVIFRAEHRRMSKS